MKYRVPWTVRFLGMFLETGGSLECEVVLSAAFLVCGVRGLWCSLEGILPWNVVFRVVGGSLPRGSSPK